MEISEGVANPEEEHKHGCGQSRLGVWLNHRCGQSEEELTQGHDQPRVTAKSGAQQPGV